MIRTNLSTRPFYNAQAVTLAIAALGVLVGLATIVNVTRIVRYTQSDSVLATQATQDTERASMLRADAAKLRGSVDTRQVDFIAAQARQANDLIDRRVFSWTELFNQFEATLPANVRITAVRPVVDDQGRIMLTISVAARGVDDVNEFMENLEKTSAFEHLLTREERMNDEGTLEATLETFYNQARAAAVVPATAGSGPATPAAAATPTPASGTPEPGGRP